MKTDRIAKRGLIVAVILAVFAAWAIYTVEHQSRHEHGRRLRSDPNFQKDFPRGAARR
jgi:hypothetical protein